MWQYNYTYPHELHHHGILGMKWGKRNGPPYPLGASDHSTSEKKAGWRKSLDKTSEKQHTKRKPSKDAEKKSGLTDKQKKAIKIGVAVAATALAAYGTYRFAKSGVLDKYIDTGKDRVSDLLEKKAGNADFGKREIESLFEQGTTQKATQTVGGLKKLDKLESLEDTLKNVNPHKNDERYDNNCTLCSIAAFLRQQGFDVIAGSTGGEPQNLGGIVEECFKGVKVLEGSATKFGRSRRDAAEMLLKRYGQNAEGVCGVQFKMSSGHAFNWKIKDGVVTFFDGQIGKDDAFISKHYWKLINPNDSLILARLDNAEANYEAIKRRLK